MSIPDDASRPASAASPGPGYPPSGPPEPENPLPGQAEPENSLPGMHPDAVPMPTAQVRMTPLALTGLALWLIGLVLVLVFDWGALARDIALVGAGLGIIATAWALYTDARRRLT